jgi:hypothetical protein
MKTKYSLVARTYPIMILLIPLVITGSYLSVNFDNYYHFFTSIGLLGALSFLLTQLGRDFGKKKEHALWKSWGGMPTIQILRFNNDFLDDLTKKRYHLRLNELCPVEHIPTKELEQINPSEIDKIYSTWTKFMISNTRDTNKYRLLYKENINYGFRRNLWGLKKIAICLILINICIITLFSGSKLGFNFFFQWTNEYFISLGLLLVILIFWILIVTKDWIKRVAFSYAERLFELTEKINVP